eukprot:13730508-Heterocapsa_arctica.AAC.1
MVMTMVVARKTLRAADATADPATFDGCNDYLGCLRALRASLPEEGIDPSTFRDHIVNLEQLCKPG